MQLLSAPNAQNRRFMQGKVDSRGNISASSAVEIYRTVGDDITAFIVGLGLVQDCVWAISNKEASPELEQRFRALLPLVLSIGEEILSTENGNAVVEAVQYLKDIGSRFSGDVDDEKADLILDAVFPR